MRSNQSVAELSDLGRLPSDLLSRLILPLYAGAIFLGAFLLFSLQPMTAKMILPLLGGAPAVWNTAMVFFQAVLLAGYAYAHFSVRCLGLRRQALLHVAVLAAALLTWPVALPEGWQPPAEAFPVQWTLALLAATVGLPFFAVSATAPLLQKWFARSGHAQAADPYFLYGTSNLGSVLALLSYPFLIEPLLRLQTQSLSWSWAYLALALSMILCFLAIRPRLAQAAEVVPARTPASRAPTWRQRGRWVALAFVPSSLLLGVTAHITTDVAATPLFWVLPLVLYLLSFVVVFARRPPIKHAVTIQVMPFGLALLPIAFSTPFGLGATLLAHLSLFFLLALFCHGALVARRPAEAHLTEFYLWMSTGGVLGGLFNAVIAPTIFSAIYEYTLVLALSALFLPAVSGAGAGRPNRGDLLVPLALAGIALMPDLLNLKTVTGEGRLDVFVFLVVLTLGIYLCRGRPLRMTAALLAVLVVPMAVGQVRDTLATARSFFGVYTVHDVTGSESFRILKHGTTIHGVQDLRPEARRTPTTYYSKAGPVGQVLAAHAVREGLSLGRVGVVGLGVGTMACYRQAGQDWTFYEIDPAVVEIARDPGLFTYLADCGEDLDIRIGDARIRLAEAAPGNYDLLVLDAFSSDAVPVHLLTHEAMGLYLEKLAPEGLILFHISNRHLDLAPTLAKVAASQGLRSWFKADREPGGGKDLRRLPSDWLAVTADPDRAELLEGLPGWTRMTVRDDADLWTDDFSNIVGVLRR